ncbi:MAG TPA: hypothetical protein VFJ17_07325 [Mycobacteriales bacterium]|nr:hypothetical protein [Mycobacteriales bacterium]
MAASDYDRLLNRVSKEIADRLGCDIAESRSALRNSDWGLVLDRIQALEDEVTTLSGERDEARQLAADLWTGLPTETKVAIFDKSKGWVPEWVRGSRNP